jgi:uncharacterized membrane protein
MGGKMAARLIEMFSGIPWPWEIFWLSGIPVTELRATIPLGVMVMGQPPWQVFLYAVLGNLLPVAFILWLLPLFFEFLCRWQPMKRFFDRTIAKARGKGRQVEKYGALGLVFFVAIPLPGTAPGRLPFGVYFRDKFLLFISSYFFRGSGGASVVTLGSMGLLAAVQDLVGLEYIVLIGILLLFAWWFYKAKQRKNTK